MPPYLSHSLWFSSGCLNSTSAKLPLSGSKTLQVVLISMLWTRLTKAGLSSDLYCLTVNRSSALKLCFFSVSWTTGTMEVIINWLSSLKLSLYLNISDGTF